MDKVLLIAYDSNGMVGDIIEITERQDAGCWVQNWFDFFCYMHKQLLNDYAAVRIEWHLND